MEQQKLPPKPPPPIHNWPSFHFQTPHSAAASWVDDFLDFSSTRRNAHRRTVSDPIAFVEENQHHNNNNNGNDHGNIGFDRLDDEQLRNMFSDDVGPASSTNPSTPSDQNYNSDQDQENRETTIHRHHRVIQQQPKDEPGDVDANKSSDSGDTTIHDPKRIKRILANRQSAQRSRVRKLQYISELERSVTTLQTEVSALSPRVAYLDHQRLLLNVDNSAIKQRIAALAQDKIFKDAHQEALKREIERLRKVYNEQNVKNTSDDALPSPPVKTMGCAADE